MEGAGDFSPLNKRKNPLGFSTGPKGRQTRVGLVGLKPHAPSVNAALASSIRLREMFLARRLAEHAGIEGKGLRHVNL